MDNGDERSEVHNYRFECGTRHYIHVGPLNGTIVDSPTRKPNIYSYTLLDNDLELYNRLCTIRHSELLVALF